MSASVVLWASPRARLAAASLFSLYLFPFSLQPRSAETFSWISGGRFRTRRKLLEPAAGHSPGLVDLPDDKHELLLADPAPILAEPPQDAQLFEEEVEFLQNGPFARGWRKDGAYGKLKGV